MAIHDEVLTAAHRLCLRRGGWRFRPLEIVHALPHLSAASVRTHVISRCCVNAPRNHPHKWDYFERVARGVYEIRRPFRRRLSPRRVVAERAASYGRADDTCCRDTIHVIISESAGWFIAECLEVAVVTQGHTLDELVANLREAITLHVEGEAPASLGLVASPRIALTYEFATRIP